MCHVHLLSSKDESLLDWRNTLLLLDTLLYPRDLLFHHNQYRTVSAASSDGCS